MKNYLVFLFGFSVLFLAPAVAQQPPSPFTDPNLPVEKRIDNLLSLMTTDEKINCLGTRTGVPRLGVPNIGSSEGIHGVVQREARGSHQPITTTQFPQPPGMGETWDPDLVRQAAAVRAMKPGSSPKLRSTIARFSCSGDHSPTLRATRVGAAAKRYMAKTHS
jgi:beta-glucosidase